MIMPYVTDHQRERIAELVDRRLSAGQIALRVGLKKQTVGAVIASRGLRPPMRAGKSYVRDDVLCYEFTPEEDAFMEALLMDRQNYAQIARATTDRATGPASGSA